MTTQLFIDGRWTAATSERTLPVVNPATGKPFAEMACASRADVDAAVDAARRALDEGPWASMTGFARRSLLLAFAAEVRCGRRAGRDHDRRHGHAVDVHARRRRGEC